MLTSLFVIDRLTEEQRAKLPHTKYSLSKEDRIAISLGMQDNALTSAKMLKMWMITNRK